MAIVNILYKAGPVQIDTLTIDVALTETHSGDVEVTDHEVETGFEISDHARPKPVKLTIEGMISNTPFSREQATRAIELLGREPGDPNAVTGQTTALSDFVQGQPGYAEAAFIKLVEMSESPRLFTITTGLKTYERMTLESFETPRDGKTGDCLRFSAKFKQIRIVSNRTATVRVKDKSGKKKKKKGKEPARAANFREEKKSILATEDDNFKKKASKAFNKFFNGLAK